MGGGPLYAFSTVATQTGSSEAGEGVIYGGSPLLEVVLLLGAMGAMAAIADLSALEGSEASDGPFLGVVLSVGAFVGVALLLVGEVVLFPWAMLAGLVLAALLSPALGLAIIRTALLLPWWCGAALMAWGVALAFSTLPLSPTMFWGAIIPGASWALVGYAVFREGTRLEEQLSRVR
jgi:hypothetical protein